ncbi:PTPRT [Branchiostoma lanceolatum]|uniref:protein-tyrosine-phosphatase n=1 Tax=Branchiostoma lanceolatum TaxID=7740 RepID=A0A8K0A5B3_BRALA|nr:PTPRT [Branchiostoma lanceolatum]
MEGGSFARWTMLHVLVALSLTVLHVQGLTVDMAVLNAFPAVDPQDRDTYIYCYSMGDIVQQRQPAGAGKYPLRVELDTGSGKKVTDKRVTYMIPPNGVAVRMLAAAGYAQVGAFSCKARMKNGGDKRVSKIITLKVNRKAHFFPMEFTRTVNLGEDVTLRMTMRSRKPDVAIAWKKDGKSVNNPVNDRPELTIRQAKKSDTGIYEVFYFGFYATRQQGIMRLIVRGCAARKWGENCEKDCPVCYNGGQCDHTTGECVCAPGFNGTNCDRGCGGNRFGQACNFRCNSMGSIDGCRGRMLCVPDPVGCVCPPGFKGPLCLQMCEEGSYGVGCSQSCHCLHGNTVCDRYTGACAGGCAAGWQGPSCQKECDDGRFGMFCKRSCHCAAGETACHKETGACSTGCAAGWRGVDCQKECDDKTFGPGCQKECHCKDGVQCDRKSGLCPAGCASGWYGLSCQDTDPPDCVEGTFGENCEFPCRCRLGEPCDQRTGVCPSGCGNGWTGTSCQQECPDGTFGPECTYQCHCDQVPCDKKFGVCRRGCAPGWKGIACNKACPDGKYGAGCSSECHCLGGPEDCDKVTGECTGGCAAGWEGPECQRECTEGKFGPGCKDVCHCRHDVPCDMYTGQCEKGCAPGWRGDDCQKGCPIGKFGEDCLYDCHCLDGNFCSRYNGTCLRGCQPGWQGYNCQEKCPLGTFGQECKGTCHCDQGLCDRITGACASGCAEGWMGRACQQKCPPGRYGTSCKGTCHCNGTCDIRTGACDGGCALGWEGPICQKSCEVGRYGLNCAQTCLCANNDVACDRATGPTKDCVCREGYFGPDCSEKAVGPDITSFTYTRVNLGQPTNFSCSARGHPPPRKDDIRMFLVNQVPGLPVVATHVGENGTRTNFFQAEVQKGEVFECVVTTEVGESRRNLTTDVFEPPYLKFQPLVIPGIMTFSLRWRAWAEGFDNGDGPVTSYSIWYRPDGEEEWTVQPVDFYPGQEEFNETLEGLAPGRTYDIAVMLSREGPGGQEKAPLKVVRQETRCGAPLEPPKDVRVQIHGPRHIIVNWDVPEVEVIRCWYYGFRVHHKKANELLDKVSVSQNQTSTTRQYNLFVSPATTYLVKVELWNLVGSNQSPYYEVKTPDDVPGPVRGFKVLRYSSKAVQVKWEEPTEKNGLLVGYQVTQKLKRRNRRSPGDTCVIPVPGNATETWRVAPNITSFMFEGLLPHSLYRLSVQAITRAGPGQEVAIEQTTAQGAPSGSIENLQVVSFQAKAMQISWDPPACESRNGNITHYEVSSEEVNSTSPLPGSETANVSTTDIWLYDLVPYTTYRLRVRAYTRAGPGPWSTQLLQRTREFRPEAPRDFQVDSVSPTSISLSWREPWPPGGIITHYEVIFWKTMDEFGAPSLLNNRTVLVNETYGPDDVIQYEIDDLSTNVNYTVNIKAFNGVGMSPNARVTAFTDESAPGPVTNLTAVDVTTNAIVVRWEKPLLNPDKVSAYEVTYQSKTKGACPLSVSFVTIYLIPNASVTEYKMFGLTPYTLYGISVRSRTKAGFSEVTEIEIRTGETVPTGPPTNILHSQVTPTSVFFTFLPPLCDQKNGEITMYEYVLVRQNATSISEWLLGNTSATTYAQKFDGLIPFTDYYFRVRGFTSAGPGPFSDAVSVRTAEDKPPAPQDLRVAFTSDTTATITWTAPSPPHGNILRYAIEIQKDGESLNTSKIIRAADRKNRLVIRDLAPFSNYSIRVRAATAVGKGPFSTSVTALTDEGVPGMPDDLTVTTTKNSIVVQWKPPLQPNGVIQGYKVSCKGLASHDPDYDPAKDVYPVEKLATEFHHVFEGLYSGTDYAITIRARTKKGYGDTAFKNCSTTIAEPPTPEAPLPVGEAKDNTVSLELKPVLPKNGPISAYYVVVQGNNQLRFLDNQGEMLDYHEASDQGKPFYITAMFSPDEVKEKKNFVVGDNKTYGGYWNAPLVEGEKYSFIYGVASELNGEKLMSFSETQRPITVSQDPSDDGPTVQRAADNSSLMIAIFVAVLLLLLLIFMILLAVYVTRRKRQGTLDVAAKEAVCLSPVAKAQDAENPEGHAPFPFPVKEGQYPPLKLEEFAEHVRLMRRDSKQGFKLEHASLPDGQTSSWETAFKEENKTKNRYGNIVPYDSSRVVLEPTVDDPSSDYINATYCDGYREKQAYIATQGPKTNTVPDLWRMAWQEHSASIVMLTNLVEMARVQFYSDQEQSASIPKQKCKQYWPDEEDTYGDITVKVKSVEELSDYTIRTFIMTKEGEGEKREIKQFHFTNWLDHDVPDHPTQLLAFIRRVKALTPLEAGPTIVHCSAGVGRTGTFIVIDAMLEMARHEAHVDIFNHVLQLRKARIQMVQTADQYAFIHEAVLEALQTGDTHIPVSEFRDGYEAMTRKRPKVKKSPLDEEFKLLVKMTPAFDPEDSNAGWLEENKRKNRDQNVLPVDLQRAVLSTEYANQSDYINAMYLDSYKTRSAFIVTQTPLPDTVADFWQMVYEHGAQTIVMMNTLRKKDKDMVQYWPDEEGGAIEYGPIRVELTATTKAVNVTMKDFLLVNTRADSEDIRVVKHFQFLGTSRDQLCSRSRGAMVELLHLLTSWQNECGLGPVVVHCLTGVGLSGVFCAAVSLCEKMEEEKSVDIFQVARTLTIQRPHIINSAEHYKFLYDVAMEYLSSQQGLLTSH